MLSVSGQVKQRQSTELGLCIDVDFSLPALRVIRSLEQVMEWRGRPKIIRCDNGPEYVSSALMQWAEKRHIQL